MSEYRKICLRFKERFGESFFARIERSFGKDLEVLLDSSPKELLVRILQDVHLHYVAPYEMILEISNYLKETHKITNFSFVFSERTKLDFSGALPEVKEFVSSFYEMLTQLGLKDEFYKSTTMGSER